MISDDWNADDVDGWHDDLQRWDNEGGALFSSRTWTFSRERASVFLCRDWLDEECAGMLCNGFKTRAMAVDALKSAAHIVASSRWREMWDAERKLDHAEARYNAARIVTIKVEDDRIGDE